jgi:hypothetical protein
MVPAALSPCCALLCPVLLCCALRCCALYSSFSMYTGETAKRQCMSCPVTQTEPNRTEPDRTRPDQCVSIKASQTRPSQTKQNKSPDKARVSNSYSLHVPNASMVQATTRLSQNNKTKTPRDQKGGRRKIKDKKDMTDQQVRNKRHAVLRIHFAKFRGGCSDSTSAGRQSGAL